MSIPVVETPYDPDGRMPASVNLLVDVVDTRAAYALSHFAIDVKRTAWLAPTIVTSGVVAAVTINLIGTWAIVTGANADRIDTLAAGTFGALTTSHRINASTIDATFASRTIVIFDTSQHTESCQAANLVVETLRAVDAISRRYARASVT